MCSGRILRSANIALALSVVLGVGLVAGSGTASAEPLPLPPGDMVRGTVFKQPGQCPPNFVPQIEDGADANANAYICGCRQHSRSCQTRRQPWW
jgi:hypothetical protein